MPRSLIRSTKHNHGRKAQRKALAVIPHEAPQAVPDLAALRSAHPDITDAEARLAVALALDGRSIEECTTQLHLPPEWVRSRIANPAFSAFLHDLGVAALGTDALLARKAMVACLRARSSYVRYAAAQDLMDRAGLRVRPAAVQPTAAAITINIGDVGTKPSSGLVTISGTSHGDVSEGAPEPDLS